MEKVRLVASQKRAIVIWATSMAVMLGTIVATTILTLIRQLRLQESIPDYAFIVGMFFGGSVGILTALALLKTEKTA